MHKFIGYQCSICGETYTPDEVTYTCLKDGGNLSIVFDYNRIARGCRPENMYSSENHSLWRYLDLLPVGNPGYSETTLWAAGYTPIYNAEQLAKKLGMRNLWIKDESRNPTASFKDRASAIVVARGLEINADVIVTASTGNAGAALAGMSAAVDQKAVIFAPRSAPPAKIAQLLIYNAQVFLVDGTYDDAFDLSIQAANEFGWYCRNTGFNPFTVEGKKTAALEIWEWMASLEPKLQEKLAVFVPVGDGNIISGIHKGFVDLGKLGWLEHMPRIYGVQAEGSAAIANAFFSGTEEIVSVEARTVADSISVDLPRDGVRAIRAARESGGNYFLVSDDEIISAIAALGSTGIFAEPAGAAAYAGLVKAIQSGDIDPDDPILVLNTGSGLKDVRAAMKAVSEPMIIDPTLEALIKAIR